MKINLTSGEINSFADDIYEVLEDIPLFYLIEILELAQAGLTVTAVAITVAVAPVAIITGEPLPDLTPLIEVDGDEQKS